MIVVEFLTERSDGVRLYRTYSSEGRKIERDGEVYDEAIDPENSGRTYTESEEFVEATEEGELSAEGALAIITGGEV